MTKKKPVLNDVVGEEVGPIELIVTKLPVLTFTNKDYKCEINVPEEEYVRLAEVINGFLINKNFTSTLTITKLNKNE